MKTWKVVYNLKYQDNGRMGVALIQADNWSQAMTIFQQQYAGQFFTIQSCTEL